VVKTGQRLPGKLEILEGLKAGDQVITAGQGKPMMMDGMPVMVLPAGGPGAPGAPGAPGGAPGTESKEAKAPPAPAPAEAKANPPAASKPAAAEPAAGETREN
jgi:membrane fusion protein (multidrug efflux system)